LTPVQLLARLEGQPPQVLDEAMAQFLRTDRIPYSVFRLAAMWHPDEEVRTRARFIVRKLGAAGESTIRRSALVPPLDRTRIGSITEKEGRISANETWTADNTYHVTGLSGLTIDPGATLTIEPGTITLLDRGAAITIHRFGTLVAHGTDTDPIVFTSVAEADLEQRSPWRGITVRGAARLEHVEIRRTLGGVLVEPDAVFAPRFLRIYDCMQAGITVRNSNADRWEDVTVQGVASGTAVIFEGGARPDVSRLRVVGAKVGVLFSGDSYPSISDMTVRDIADEGVLLRDGSNPGLTNIELSNCGVGLRMHDANGRMYGVRISNCVDGIRAEIRSSPRMDDVWLSDIVGMRFTSLSLRPCMAIESAISTVARATHSLRRVHESWSGRASDRRLTSNQEGLRVGATIVTAARHEQRAGELPVAVLGKLTISCFRLGE
jgi:hypothetical protein